MEIRDSIQSDLDFARINPIETDVKDYPQLNLVGYAKTGLIGNRIIGLGGVIPMWEGVGEFWIILTKESQLHKVETFKCIYRIVEEAIIDLHLVRAQAIVDCDFDRANKMVETLGFILEGRLEKYLPNSKDAFIYKRMG